MFALSEHGATSAAARWLAQRENEADLIGGVNDLLFDKSGKILGVMVGVGGFLGVGQKNVAMEIGAFQMVPASTG